MNFFEFQQGMKKHFGITRGVNHYIGWELSNPSIAVLDITHFDKWLIQQHGDFTAKEGLSIRDLVKKEYGAIAEKFIVDAVHLY